MLERDSINIQARREYALVLRRFMAGRITNLEYLERVEHVYDKCGFDRGVELVFRACWYLLCDVYRHRLTDAEWRPPEEVRLLVSRCVLFLRNSSMVDDVVEESDEALSINPWWAVFRVVAFGMLMVTLSALIGVTLTAVLFAGISLILIVCAAITCEGDSLAPNTARLAFSDRDDNVWPFRTASDFLVAIQAPCYLCGITAIGDRAKSATG